MCGFTSSFLINVYIHVIKCLIICCNRNNCNNSIIGLITSYKMHRYYNIMRLYMLYSKIWVNLACLIVINFVSYNSTVLIK